MSNAKIRARRRRRKQAKTLAVFLDETCQLKPGMTHPPRLVWGSTTDGAPRGHHFITFRMVP